MGPLESKFYVSPRTFSEYESGKFARRSNKLFRDSLPTEEIEIASIDFSAITLATIKRPNFVVSIYLTYLLVCANYGYTISSATCSGFALIRVYVFERGDEYCRREEYEFPFKRKKRKEKKWSYVSLRISYLQSIYTLLLNTLHCEACIIQVKWQTCNRSEKQKSIREAFNFNRISRFFRT